MTKSRFSDTAQITQDLLKLWTTELLDILGNVTLYLLFNPKAAVQFALPTTEILQGIVYCRLSRCKIKIKNYPDFQPLGQFLSVSYHLGCSLQKYWSVE